MTPEFWRNRRVFLTGHTGFKGSWLSLWLQRHGAVVTGLALDPPTDPNLFTLASVAEGMSHSLVQDIRDREAVAAALTTAAPEIVFHLAAQPLVRDGYQLPVETFDTNVMGTVHLLDAVRNIPSVKAVVVVTTDKCYQNREWIWGYREDEPMGGDDPYSASKGCAELVTSSYRTAFFSDADRPAVASVRAGNVIGGGDFARDRLVPDIMAAIRSHTAAAIRNPHAIRPWQHVLDPLHGYLLLAERLVEDGPRFAEAWNFGPAEADAQPVAWIADRVTEAWGDGAAWTTDDREHPHEANYLKLDSSKARTRLGWETRLPLGHALDWIVSWHRTFSSGGDVRAHTLDELARYEQRG
jgi:CDP-glucose 4,6-dehydratase